MKKECQHARQVAAADMALDVSLGPGVRLVDAGGYPIEVENGRAVIFPGSLVSGGEQRLFLTFQIPTDEARVRPLGAVQVRYQHRGRPHILADKCMLQVACVPDQEAVLASVDEGAWREHVVQNAFNRLKEEVAAAARSGDADGARERIRECEARQSAVNAAVGSAAVEAHLKEEVSLLRESVADTFTGAPAEVAAKQQVRAKTWQYESYQKRRDKQ